MQNFLKIIFKLKVILPWIFNGLPVINCGIVNSLTLLINTL